MEHIPLPYHHDPILTSTPLEYVGSTYDNGPFDTYPERRGFNLIHNVYFKRESTKAAAVRFYQTWLYFSLLYTVLDVSDPSPFLKHENGITRVTTEKLNQITKAHRQKVLSWNKKDRAMWFKRVCKSYNYGVQMYAQKGLFNKETNIWTNPSYKTSRVQLSIALLGEALGEYLALIRCTHKDPILPLVEYYSWKSDLLCLPNEIFDRKGWCLSERRKISASMTAKAFGASVKLNRLEEDHTKCSAEACVANTVKEENYVTKHTISGCSCEFLGLDQDKVKLFLESDTIPIIKVDLGVDGSIENISCEGEKLQDDSLSLCNFVAISHVWSDGLGNLRDNKLPYCQLARIAKFCSEIPAVDINEPLEISRNVAGPVTVRFWIDTLCVPLDSMYRAMAVRQINNIYREADMVLVLDQQLQDFLYITDEEAMFRIAMSGWMRRAWTYLEGIIGRICTIFRFKDAFVDPWYMFRRLAALEDGIWVGGLLLRQIVTFGTDGMFELSDFQRQPSPKGANKIAEISRKLSMRTIYQEDDEVRLKDVWTAMKFRSTTREDDLALIACILLRLDTKRLLRQPKENRMQGLYDLLEGFPISRSILFSPTIPRIQREPYRWAPSIFHANLWDDSEGSPKNCILTAKGLNIAMDGILFTKGNVSNDEEFIQFKIPWKKKTYIIDYLSKYIRQAGWGDIMRRPEKSMAVLLDDPVEPRARLTPVSPLQNEEQIQILGTTYGCLISVKERDKARGIIIGRFEATLSIAITESKPDWGFPIESCSYLHNQRWLLR